MHHKLFGQRDCHLHQLSAKLSRLCVSVGHSQKSGDLGAGGSVGVGTPTTWSGRPQWNLEGVAVAVADRLVPIFTDVTHVNEPIMRLRTSHALGFTSLVSTYARIREVNSP